MPVNTKTKRKKAPEVIEDVWYSERSDLQKKLNEENPDWVYAYQRHNVTERELARNDQEVVKTEEGEVMALGDSIVVRTPREVWEQKREIQHERSRLSAATTVSRQEDDELIPRAKKPRS